VTFIAAGCVEMAEQCQNSAAATLVEVTAFPHRYFFGAFSLRKVVGTGLDP